MATVINEETGTLVERFFAFLLFSFLSSIREFYSLNIDFLEEYMLGHFD